MATIRRTSLALLCAAVGWPGCAASTDRESVPGWPEGAFSPKPGAAKVSFRDTPRPWILGHRGSGMDRPHESFPENTLPSFLAAIRDEGAVGVEADVMLTRDDEVVILHDWRLDRTTTCTGCASEMDLEEILACAAKGTHTSGTRPIDLATLLRAMAELPVEPLVSLDAKSNPEEGCPAPRVAGKDLAGHLGRRVGEVVREVGTSSYTALQGSDEVLLAATRVVPDLMTFRVTPGEMSSSVTAAIRRGFTGVEVGFVRVTDDSVRRARAAGLLIDAAVVDAPIDVAIAGFYDLDILETDQVKETRSAFGADE